MKTFIAAFWGALLALVVFVMIPVVAFRSHGHKGSLTVTRGATLVQPLSGNLRDYPVDGFRSPLSDADGTSQTEMLENLKKAAVDKRITRVLLDMGPLGAGFSKCEELRQAIHAVRKAGKTVIAWSPVFEPKSYSVAVACDSIAMIPSGQFVFTGFDQQRMYVKGLLDKIGLHENVDRIESYKSAAEMTMRTDMSPAARENAQRLLDDQVRAFRAALREERGLTDADIDDLLAHPLMTAEDALARKLIDRCVHHEELISAWRGQRSKSKLVEADDYIEVEPGTLGLKGKKTIAVVHGQGMILEGGSGEAPLVGETLGSDSFIREMDRAAEDDDVAALVLRLDTGGGDAWASDAIGREVERIKAKKPVIVSMGDACASGGYVIAYRATSIVALPSTLTGSIGSITGKYNLAGLNAKLGLSYDGVSWGPHAQMFSGLTDWTPEEKAMVREDHWKGYNRWIAAVAESRRMTVAEVDSLGRGRVWTGREALGLKLVDKLGGLDVALDEAKEKAGIRAGDKVTVRHYPRARSFLESLLKGEGEDFVLQWMTRTVGQRLERVRATLQSREWLVMDGPF